MSQVYKATLGDPLSYKYPQDPDAKLFYEFNYGATTDDYGNTITPVVVAGTSEITDSTWTVSPATVTLASDTFTTTATRVRVGPITGTVTSFVLTNHVEITYSTGDIEEDDRSIEVTVSTR